MGTKNVHDRFGVWRSAAKVIAVSALSLCVLAGCGGSVLPYDTYDTQMTMDESDAMSLGGSEKVTNSSGDISSRDVELESGMVAYDSDVTISTRDFDGTTKAIDDALTKAGAVTQADSVSKSELGDGVEYRTRNISVRVPAEKVSELKAALEAGDFTIESMDISGYDMASNYHDYELELDSLQKRYDWYAEQAESVDDPELAREYFDEMSSLVSSMDEIKRQMKDTETDVAWSRVSIYIFEDVSLRDAKRAQGMWSSLGEALTQLPVRFAYVLGMFLYVVVMLMPYAVVVAAIVFAIRFFSKKGGKKKKGADEGVPPVSEPSAEATPSADAMAQSEPATGELSPSEDVADE